MWITEIADGKNARKSESDDAETDSVDLDEPKILNDFELGDSCPEKGSWFYINIY